MLAGTIISEILLEIITGEKNVNGYYNLEIENDEATCRGK